MDHDDWLLKKLQDSQFAAEFLAATKEDDDPEAYRWSLEQVALARGKKREVANYENSQNED